MTRGKGYDPERYPMKRLGEPEEIAATAAFLLKSRRKLCVRRDFRHQRRRLLSLTNSRQKKRKKMKAAWYERNGPARDVLTVGTMPDPVPGVGEVRACE